MKSPLLKNVRSIHRDPNAFVAPEAYQDAFAGLAGDFVRLVFPHTEADPFALLVQFLAAFGNAIGRSAHQLAEADHHFTNLFAVLVGQSAKGRKGSSWGHVKRVMAYVDQDWSANCLFSGLSTGEGLIHHVRDAREPEPNGKRDNVPDPGVTDKRAFVIASEFATILAAMQRQGNTLSSTLRDAWDRGDLRTMTKGSPERATGAHVSITAHVTRDELRRLLTATECGNGFANRFLWVNVARSKMLPEGGSVDDRALTDYAERVEQAASFARGVMLVRRDDAARQLWAEIYPRLSAGASGLFGAVTSRAEAQVLRLSTLYALLDESETVRPAHLRSADAVWRYCEESARSIFGQSTGDPDAEAILSALSEAKEATMTKTEIHERFGRKKPVAEIDRAIEFLKTSGRIEVSKDGTAGRPVMRVSLKDNGEPPTSPTPCIAVSESGDAEAVSDSDAEIDAMLEEFCRP